MPHSDRTIRYFTSYSGVRLPLNLVGELAADDMHNRNTYFRGEFDGTGLLTHCDKVVYGEVEVSHNYQYHPDGRLAQAVIDDGNDDPKTIDYPA